MVSVLRYRLMDDALLYIVCIWSGWGTVKMRYVYPHEYT